MQSRKVNWGILGTGLISGIFAEALKLSETGSLLAVASRQKNTAEQFASRFGIPKAYQSYEELLSDPEVQIVYISLPNHLHCEWAIRCAEWGKHILCEKPAATNSGEVMTIVEYARRHNVFFMEAFMYRCHPQTAKLAALIKEGAVGKVRFIRVTFSESMGDDSSNIRMQNAVAGGAIMDIGCYCTSMARLLAGAAIGQDLAEPEEVKGVARLGAHPRVDEWATALLRFPGDVLAILTCGNQVDVDPTLEVWGSEGFIRATNPWKPGLGGRDEEILLSRKSEGDAKTIAVPTPGPLYVLEADAVGLYLAQRQAPCMNWTDTIGNMKTLDAWRRDVQLVFDCEREEALAVPFSGRPLETNPAHEMSYGQVDGIANPVSRIVLGSVMLDMDRLPYSFALLDFFFEQGGNCIDTAWVYRHGGAEKCVGAWIEKRAIREKIVLIGKGASTARCTPELVTTQLLDSLERLRTEYVDIYLMHRDNPSMPVGEFVECLNQHYRAGRIRCFGGSNWTTRRLAQANTYAAAHGLRGFAASSPNFSLAVWNEPTWIDCVSASDRASREWYARTRTPLFAWSSQAAGFFTGRYSESEPDKPGTTDMARVWFNEGNFERLRRARELSQSKGVTPNQVALAYVLCESPNTFALVGPESIEELRQSIQALQLKLAPSERRWLNLES
jgi:predicted dehydrogenase/aryl-alcohol dehydrogenase-like predicted oxidoreductase